MQYTQCTITVVPQQYENLIIALSTDGFDQFQFENAGDCDIVTLYLSQLDEVRRLRACLASVENCACTESTIDEEDWANNWKQYYQPIDIGTRLRIQPAWQPLENPDNRVIFYNNPGMSFGTGTHASTFLCLQILEQHIKHNDRILDLGCGSGILFITASLLGASGALAVDIDPLACQTAATNAFDNRIKNYKIEHGDLTADPQLMQKLINFHADFICANLVADLIIHLTPQIKKLLKPNARLLTSGILNEHAASVTDALGLPIIETRQKDGWTAILFCNR